MNMAMMMITILAVSLISPGILYLGLLCLLVLLPPLQVQLFYLHKLPLVNREELNAPETFGYLAGQVTPFLIDTSDYKVLHAWHVLPFGIYARHQEELQAKACGITSGIRERLAFKLLREDPEARVVISFHGVAGCLASGWRPYNYRNLYCAAPDKVHVLALDYRGYGKNSGTPSEEGLILDAISAVEWVLHVAGVPPQRIAIFGHSLGTGVGLAVLTHYATQEPAIEFAGAVFSACFTDVAALVSTYRIAGMIPILSPLAYVPPLLSLVTSFLQIRWSSKDRVSEYVSLREKAKARRKYYLAFLHAKDDTAITYRHSDVMFWHAVKSATGISMTYQELEERKKFLRRSLGEGGWELEWQTSNGVIRQLMLKYGGHDKIVTLPAVALAILRAFQNADPSFSS